MNWHIKKFDELSTTELYNILNLRNEIFVVEQDCVYLDTDYADQHCFHIFLEHDGNVIAYARAVPPNIKFDHISFGRVIVSKAYRNQGIAKQLITHTLQCIKENFGPGYIEINGQSYLVKFYESFGFKCIGDEFLEDGLPHFKMLRD